MPHQESFRRLSAPLAWIAPALLGLALRTGPIPPQQVGPDGARLIARVGSDLLLPRAEYAEHLIAISGQGPLDDWIYGHLLAREAERLGRPLSAQQVAERVDARIAELIAVRHRGDASAFAADLAGSGFNVASYRRLLTIHTHQELLEDAVVRATRQVDRQALQGPFEQRYGPGGVRVRVRHLLLTRAQLRANLIAAGESPERLDNATLDRRMAELMASFKERLAAGESFEALCRAESHDLASRPRGGEIESVDLRGFGAEFLGALETTPVGQVSAPVNSSIGLHLVSVLGRETTRFEDVEAALREEALGAAPNPLERRELRERLLNAQPIERY